MAVRRHCRWFAICLLLAAVTLAAEGIAAPLPGNGQAAVVDTIRPPTLLEYVNADIPGAALGAPRVALVLSGGGARGLAQIGVLRAFEESGITFDVICGVSMGAIVGGLYAAGIGSDSLETLARSVDWRELLKNAPPRTRLLLSQKEKAANWLLSIPLKGFKPRWPTGAITGQALYNYLSSLTQRASYRSGGDFDRLRVPYRAVVTDLVTGERIIFEAGELAFAMRAAMAFPLAVTPLQDGNRLYADGGLVDPLPVGLARTLSDRPIVAVNTASGLAALEELTDPYAVANQATTIMTAAKLEQALGQADHVCTPAVEGIANLGFGEIDTLIALGYAAGRKVAAAILSDTHGDVEESYDEPNLPRYTVELADGLAATDCPPELATWILEGTPVTRSQLEHAVAAHVQRGTWWRATITEAASPADRIVLAADKPPILREIRFTGISVFPAAILEAASALERGNTYDLPAIAHGLRRIIRHYVAREYTLADIRHATFDTSGVLTVAIDEAPLVGIELTGNKAVRNWVILRSFPMKPGTPSNARKVAEGLSDLHAGGLFEQVTNEVTRTGDGPVLHLHVTEKTTDALRVGLHHNLEYQTESFLQWADVNLFGLGNELTVHTQYAPRREHHFIHLRSDRIFRTYLAAGISAYYRRHERRLYSGHERDGEFETTRIGFEATFAQNISRFAQIAVLVSVENIDFKVDTTIKKLRHARVAVIGSLDDLDDADFPRHGRRMKATISWADDFFNGDVIYRAFRADGLAVLSPAEPLSLFTGFQFATADRKLPLYERLGLGGRRSFMGLADDELLQDHVVAATLGIRFRVYPYSYLVVRGDVGNAWPHGLEVDFWGTLRAGVGGGLMFDTPIGPLVILQGLADGGDTKFYFSWGYDF